jgi:ABC-type molybdate transport system substrate-binding protein
VAVQRGVADVAIVYASDALVANELVVVYPFPSDLTPEIRYVAVAVSNKPEAIGWIRQLESAKMRGVRRALGFDPPRP